MIRPARQIPFKSFIATREEQEKAKDQDLSGDTGIVSVGSCGYRYKLQEGKWAMVKDSKGVGHVIKEGTPIGTNNGVVYKITQGEVIIREEYKDFRGQTQYREISKVLNKS